MCHSVHFAPLGEVISRGHKGLGTAKEESLNRPKYVEVNELKKLRRRRTANEGNGCTVRFREDAASAYAWVIIQAQCYSLYSATQNHGCNRGGADVGKALMTERKENSRRKEN